MPDQKSDNEPTIIERWLEDQQEWQKTAMNYLDSMAQNDDFLVNLGNAMRGSLLAGKPYPTSPPAGTPVDEAPADERLDEVLYALHRVQGQLEDLRVAVAELQQTRTVGATGSAKSGAKPANKATRPRTKKIPNKFRSKARVKTKTRQAAQPAKVEAPKSEGED